jgi:drug/metabolite transporter (DMT)-like permease
MAPVFGKQAILAGFPPIGVVALRTGMAAGLLFAAILVFRRPYLYIYPAGLLGCLLAGGINGLGSLLYYSALGRIDASVGQLVYSLYPVFVAGWLWLDHQPPARLTLVRLSLAVPAVALLTQSQSDRVDMLGIGLMFTASILYALHLPINQRVLYEMPAPTVTLYTLLAMSVVVVGGYFVLGAPPLPASLPGWQGVFWLTLVTFLSRSLLFLGVKHLGGMQTALLGLGELLVTVVFAHLWLGERLSTLQWLGAILLGLSLVLVGFEKAAPPKPNPAQGWLRWFSQPRLPPDIP